MPLGLEDHERCLRGCFLEVLLCRCKVLSQSSRNRALINQNRSRKQEKCGIWSETSWGFVHRHELQDFGHIYFLTMHWSVLRTSPLFLQVHFPLSSFSSIKQVTYWHILGYKILRNNHNGIREHFALGRLLCEGLPLAMVPQLALGLSSTRKTATDWTAPGIIVHVYQTQHLGD